MQSLSVIKHWPSVVVLLDQVLGMKDNSLVDPTKWFPSCTHVFVCCAVSIYCARI